MTDKTKQQEALESLVMIEDDLVRISKSKYPSQEYPDQQRKLKCELSWIDEQIETIRTALQFDPEAVIKEIEGLKRQTNTRCIDVVLEELAINKTVNKTISIIRKHMNQEKGN